MVESKCCDKKNELLEIKVGISEMDTPSTSEERRSARLAEEEEGRALPRFSTSTGARVGGLAPVVSTTTGNATATDNARISVQIREIIDGRLTLEFNDLGDVSILRRWLSKCQLALLSMRNSYVAERRKVASGASGSMDPDVGVQMKRLIAHTKKIRVQLNKLGKSKASRGLSEEGKKHTVAVRALKKLDTKEKNIEAGEKDSKKRRRSPTAYKSYKMFIMKKFGSKGEKSRTVSAALPVVDEVHKHKILVEGDDDGQDVQVTISGKKLWTEEAVCVLTDIINYVVQFMCADIKQLLVKTSTVTERDVKAAWDMMAPASLKINGQIDKVCEQNRAYVDSEKKKPLKPKKKFGRASATLWLPPARIGSRMRMCFKRIEPMAVHRVTCIVQSIVEDLFWTLIAHKHDDDEKLTRFSGSKELITARDIATTISIEPKYNFLARIHPLRSGFTTLLDVYTSKKFRASSDKGWERGQNYIPRPKSKRRRSSGVMSNLAEEQGEHLAEEEEEEMEGEEEGDEDTTSE
jgi:hypothetical protein